MTKATINSGLIFPQWHYFLKDPNSGFVTLGTMDAATEKVALIGRVHLETRGATKTISAAGGGLITWRSGAVTFANGGTTVDVGIQDVATGSGPPAQPDGTFDVSATLTGGGGGISANSYNATDMTSGTKSITDGDLIAIVFDMTARGGADSVVVQGHSGSVGIAQPTASLFTGGAWASATAHIPATAYITFDDGTLGIIDGAIPYVLSANESFQDSTNPDERGMMFQVPWNVDIDAFYCFGATGNNAAADLTFKLYSDPTGTPSLVTSLAILQEQQLASTNARPGLYRLPSAVSLTRNTNYALTVLATGTANTNLEVRTLNTENLRKFVPGSTTLAKVTRDGSSGAFTAESPAVSMYNMGVRICAFDDGTGSGSGGGLKLAGRGGLAA